MKPCSIFRLALSSAIDEPRYYSVQLCDSNTFVFGYIGNWLPAPDGPMFLAMRLYWPKTEAPSILPPGEGAWAPPAIQRVH